MAKKTPFSPKEVTLLEAYISGKFDLPGAEVPAAEAGDGAAEAAKNQLYPFGVYGNYVFDLPRMVFKRVDGTVGKFFDRAPGELTTRFFPDFIRHIVVPEHQHAGMALANKALEWMHQHSGEDTIVNLSCNIKNGTQGHRRILFQARPKKYNGNGFFDELEGYVVDITHIQADGPPQLCILSNGELRVLETGAPEDLLRNIDLPLNAKDLAVLSLKNKGLRVKEIARELHMQELSIYSIFRDIKKKTQLELLPLISMLKEKGLI